MTAPAPKRDSLNLRIRSADRSLIERAAESQGKTKTDFILDAARRAAEEALLDRAVFTLDGDAYSAFVAQLDAPPQPNAALRRTLATRPPWDEA